MTFMLLTKYLKNPEHLNLPNAQMVLASGVPRERKYVKIKNKETKSIEASDLTNLIFLLIT